MALNENAFFQYKETRALSGYKSAWLYKDPDLGKYCLVGATETVPYVFGDKDTMEFDILQSATKGQVEGKPSLEAQDIEVLHHRDNAYRFNKMKGKTIDFMTINGEFMGYKFSGTIDYRPNNAEADVNRATVTITPMSADATPVYNARSEIVETLCFASAIPATIKVGEEFDISVVQNTATTSYKLTQIKENNVEDDGSTVQSLLNKEDPKHATISAEGLYAITVSDTAEAFAPWTTTVYVESAT
jgi:hypothetical protein